VIDDILVPLSNGNRSSNDIYNPDALTFLTNANSFDIGNHRVRSFYQRVVVNKKESLFQAEGFHTFFIPVEEGFKVSNRKSYDSGEKLNYLYTHALIASTAPRYH
jgi:fasciclin 1